MTETEPSPQTHPNNGQRSAEPVDVVVERLNDPGVAASLVTLLDNAELLSTLVLGLGGLMSRGEFIMDTVAEGVAEFKTARGDADSTNQLPSVSDLSNLAGHLSAGAPVLANVLESKMVEPETIELLSTLSEAATEGVATAKANGTTVNGMFGAMKSLKDPEVQRGLGVLIEISRALGRRVG